MQVRVTSPPTSCAANAGVISRVGLGVGWRSHTHTKERKSSIPSRKVGAEAGDSLVLELCPFAPAGTLNACLRHVRTPAG